MESGDALFIRNGHDEVDTNDHDDVWDDSALIRAYDLAVNAVKDKIAQRLGINDPETNDKNVAMKIQKNSTYRVKELKWQVGDACRCVYTEDGELYEATIKSLNQKTGQCVVKYVGYENEEEVSIYQLILTAGTEARLLQEEEALCDAGEEVLDTSNFQKGAQYTDHFAKSGSSKKKNGRKVRASFGSQFPPHNHPLFSRHPGSSSNVNIPYTIPSAPPPPPPLSFMAELPVGETEALSSMLMSWYMSGFHTGYYQGLQQAKRLQDASKQTP